MELKIFRIKNSPIDSNCYVISQNNDSDCIIIDPGTYNCEKLEKYLQRLSLSPSKIILTHEHFDHIGGVNYLRYNYNCALVTSSICSNLIVSQKHNLSLFYDGKGFCIDKADLLVEDIDYKLYWKDKEVSFFEAKGHSKGSIFIILDNYLFTGDTLIYQKKTVTKLPGGKHSDLIETLDKLTTYRGRGYHLLPGHGNSFPLDDYDMQEALG